MSELDQFSSDLVKKYTGQVPGLKTPAIDDFSHDLVQQSLKAAPGGVIDESGVHVDPTKDWDFARELIDSAVDGKYSDWAGERFQKAKAAWAKENGGQAVLAKAVGETAPALALSALTGQGELALTRLLSVPKLGEFLTGTAEGNALMRTASQATWGAQQGALSAGYNRALGQDDNIAGGAAVGAVVGPLASKLFVGSVTPSERKLAEQWRQQGLPLSTAQLPGAPLLVKAYSKLFGLGRKDAPKLTESLMKSTGSSEKLLNAETLKNARQDIKMGLDRTFPGSSIATLNDDEVTSMIDKLGPMLKGNSSQAQALRLYGNQWTNANVLDKMRTPTTELSGVVDPSRVLSAVQSRAASYPGGLDASAAAAAAGNPVDLGVLGRGAQAFVRGPMGNPLEHHPFATVGAIGAAEPIMSHLAPYAESYLNNPSAIMTGGALAGLGPVLNSQLYMKMLLGGATPNALLPALQRTYGDNLGASAVNALGAFNPVSPAQGSTIAAPDALQPVIASNATKYGVDPDMLTRQLHKESGFQNLGPNKQGATGIAQFVPSTAKQYGIDPTDPVQSVEGQAHYMSDLTNQFGNSGLALAAYNWGPGNVSKWLASGADPKKLPDETSDYVRTVSGQPIESWLPNVKRLNITMSPSNAPPNYFLAGAATGAVPDNSLSGSPQ